MTKLKEELKLSREFNLKTYDNYMPKHTPAQRLILEYVAEELKNNPNSKIVEFGAGTGRFTE